MGRAFVYVILGGGVAAGYAALEFVKKGVSHAPARLPSFHTCVGANEERLTPKWYKEHGIELVLGTRVKSADVLGLRSLKNFGVNVSDAENVCYLRDVADANKLVDVMQSCAGGSAVVIGGGYIGMECAASLVINKINVTMVFPEAHCMPRLFTPKIANYYEEYYTSEGVNFIKGTVLSSFDFDSNGKAPINFFRTLRALSGKEFETSNLVEVAVLFAGTWNYNLPVQIQVYGEGGIKVNGKLQSSDSSVYAIGDVAAFPVKVFGETRRLEHVDSARKSAKHAVSSIMDSSKTEEFDYLPFFYSRVFTLSWQFYGDNVGEVICFGDFSGSTFGAYWVSMGYLVGSFLEGGTKEEYEAIAKTTRLRSAVEDLAESERQGLGFAVTISQKPLQSPPADVSGSDLLLEEKPLHVCMLQLGLF
ncbi:hypothetical protein L6164_005112 [Bauhinia variegata]|uniref:Uncharacterized protein n=1 Tax=Bauhinia variegata TaxID=167791 RepID=A0ACB9PQ96_BAUVA|nr:hypothetical protein L6164_005112 [Bauhinia variegata]